MDIIRQKDTKEQEEEDQLVPGLTITLKWEIWL
jgi:hypothetical protein